MASSVIASDSFAGEKERKTIEGLLATPISDGELMLGKILVSFIPSVAVTLLAFMGYCISVDVMSLRLFDGKLLLPNTNWILLILFLAPTIALTAIGLTVTISSRVRGFREAQQISILLILPILGLLFAQASGAIIIGPAMILILTIILLILNAIIFKIGLKLFQREEILTRIK
jgi:ABC-type Na+ efflux pump permease subunit